MGRTEKSIEYFPHLLKDSATVRALEILYGNNGYAVWFKLLEVLGKEKDYKYCANTPESCNKLLEVFKIDGKLLGKIIGTLCDLNAIDKDMWKNRILYVPNLVNNIQKMKKKVNTNTNLIEAKEPKNIEKKKYLDYVYLKDVEYQKLISKFGEDKTKDWIETANLWIAEAPNEKKRIEKTSHYHMILNWDRMDKERNKNNNGKRQQQYRDLSNYNFD